MAGFSNLKEKLDAIQMELFKAEFCFGIEQVRHHLLLRLCPRNHDRSTGCRELGMPLLIALHAGLLPSYCASHAHAHTHTLRGL